MSKSSRRVELEAKITKEQEDRWFNVWAKGAKFDGYNYYIGRLYASEPRELFLMFIADQENIDYKGKRQEIEDEVE